MPLGDRALLARFTNERSAATWFATNQASLRARPGVIDIALSCRSVAVFANPDYADLDALAQYLSQPTSSVVDTESSLDASSLVELPVLYDGDDLEFVAGQRDMTIDDVIDAHCGTTYQVFAIGFLPGFPYAGYLPESLSGVPRRTSPRKSVAAGSVAIAGRQTGVYPQASPGGWHLIGRTPLVIADMKLGHFPIRAGDQLRFLPIDRAEYERRLGEWLVVPRGDARVENTAKDQHV